MPQAQEYRFDPLTDLLTPVYQGAPAGQPTTIQSLSGGRLGIRETTTSLQVWDTTTGRIVTNLNTAGDIFIIDTGTGHLLIDNPTSARLVNSEESSVQLRNVAGSIQYNDVSGQPRSIDIRTTTTAGYNTRVYEVTDAEGNKTYSDYTSDQVERSLADPAQNLSYRPLSGEEAAYYAVYGYLRSLNEDLVGRALELGYQPPPNMFGNDLKYDAIRFILNNVYDLQSFDFRTTTRVQV